VPAFRDLPEELVTIIESWPLLSDSEKKTISEFVMDRIEKVPHASQDGLTEGGPEE